MAKLDVSDILLDPDIAGQALTVLRRQQTVNTYGELAWTTVQYAVVGSVQPSGDQALIREEGFDAQAKSVKVIVNFRLRGVSELPVSNAEYKPDIILWQGFYFEVVAVEDYTPFGAGFVAADCTSVTYVDPPPTEEQVVF